MRVGVLPSIKVTSLLSWLGVQGFPEFAGFFAILHHPFARDYTSVLLLCQVHSCLTFAQRRFV